MAAMLAAVGLAAGSAGCALDAAVCTTDADCPEGQRCRARAGEGPESRHCLARPGDEDDDAGGNGGADEGQNNDDEPSDDGNNGTPGSDAGGLEPGDVGGIEEDAWSASDAGEVPDEGDAAEAPGDVSGESCLVNPFTTSCDDPSEGLGNSWMDAILINDGRAVGCPLTDEFVGLDMVIEGTLCSDEQADWYSLSMVECFGKTYYLDLTLTPKGACHEEHFELSVQHHPCRADHVYCELTEEGGRRVIVKVASDASPNISSYRFWVDGADLSAQSRAQFDYDLQVVVR